MKAELEFQEKRLLADGLAAEIVIGRVPTSVRGSTHFYKYRLALIDDDVCVLRYDNEAGKGDHKHVGREEVGYTFSTIEALLRDFQIDAVAYQRRKKR